MTRLDQIRRRLEAAMPDIGPEPHRVVANKTGGHRIEAKDHRWSFIGSSTFEWCNFVAHAPTDIRDLLELAAALQTMFAHAVWNREREMTIVGDPWTNPVVELLKRLDAPVGDEGEE